MMIFATLDETANEYVFTSELAARRMMSELDKTGVKHYYYWHRSVCEHIITIKILEE
jgi:hypothetical protein